MAQADVFIFLDDVQYSKNSYQNRVKIKTPTGPSWLTQSVRKSEGAFRKTNEVSFSSEQWSELHLKTIQGNYARSPFFARYFELLQEMFVSQSVLLAETNSMLIRRIALDLGIRCEFLMSSSLNITTTSTQRLVDLVSTVGGSEYIYGQGGIKYQDNDLFTNHGLDCKQVDFHHPIYSQLWGEFIPGLSIIDFLMMEGSDCSKIMSTITV